MNRYRAFILIFSSALFLSSPSLKATVIYDEGVSGDLTFPNPTFNFSLGTNTIIGTSALGDDRSDPDAFNFTIPTSTEVSSITYSFSNLVLGGFVHNMHMSFLLRGLTFNTIASSDSFIIVTDLPIGPGPSPVSLFGADLPFAAEFYRWSRFTSGWSGTASLVDQADWDYQIDFVVHSVGEVPEPSTLILLGLGLAGLGWSKRRKA